MSKPKNLSGGGINTSSTYGAPVSTLEGDIMNKDSKTVEKFTLDDGRLAERHISHNEQGETVFEVYVQEKMPLKLEKRVTEKKKEIVAEQRIEVIKDGEVVDVQVLSTEPQIKLELREHIAKVENAEIGSLNYATKKDLVEVATQAVLAGLNSVKQSAPAPTPAPLFKAQNVLAERVESKKKNDTVQVVVMVAALVAQVAFFGYLLLG